MQGFTLLYSKVTAVLLASTYMNLGLIQPLLGLSLEVYSEKLSSNMVFKIVNVDPLLEKAICLDHQERKHTMN